MNNNIKIEIKKDKKIIKLLKTFKINMYNITYKKETIEIIINQKDLKKIEKLTKYKIIKKYGIENIKEKIKKNVFDICLIMLFITSIIIISKIIIKINITTENQEIKKIISNELEQYSIKKFTFQKSNEELNKIKKSITENNKNNIGWINIKKIGMSYQINIEEKIVANKKNPKNFCNIVANQEGIITKIITKNGTQLVEKNEHVNKDDILISGETTYNNEIKKVECAEGEVYAKTWYTINLSIPKNYKKVIKTDKSMYNICIKTKNRTKKIFKKKFDNSIISNIKTIKFFNTEVKIIKEHKAYTKNLKYTPEEINKKIESMIEEKMKKILKSEGRIIEQKVLKKNDFNSTIELDIFIVAEEKINFQKSQ